MEIKRNALGLTPQEVELLSPMMQQYVSAKEDYSDCVVMFRVGDFYEMFFTEAEEISKLLGLALTSKACGLPEKAPMCGVPSDARDIYIRKLVEQRKKVVVCEQVTKPAKGVALLEREVIRVVTPGTVTDLEMLEQDSNNYLCGACVTDTGCALAFTDISTGEALIWSSSRPNWLAETMGVLARFHPSEIVYNQEFLNPEALLDYWSGSSSCEMTHLDGSYFEISGWENKVFNFFRFENGAPGWENLGISEGMEKQAVCGLFGYISYTVKNESLAGRFCGVERYETSRFMGLSERVIRNLELLRNINSYGKQWSNAEIDGSLMGVLDETSTHMGRRLLRSWIERPLTREHEILARLDAVEELMSQQVAMADLRDFLKQMCDMERLLTRTLSNKATPMNLKSFAATLEILPKIKAVLGAFSSRLLKQCHEMTYTLDDAYNLLINAISEDQQGWNDPAMGVIKAGCSPELDRKRELLRNGQALMEEIAEKERKSSGIKSIRLDSNRVTGYYFEVGKSQIDKVPGHFIQKGNTSNSVRYVTEELKQVENEIITAKDSIVTLEEAVLEEIQSFIAGKTPEVQSTATALAILDVLISFAVVSSQYQYVRPQISTKGVVEIKNGRHPVVEQRSDAFVPNDLFMDLEGNRVLIITGPNMSGKSTYMRQTAIIVLMAQMGCFVPADYAMLPLVDQIFTRIGASDDLAGGKSTFMVEMTEVADILKNATKSSLVLLDEVGRGTSTFDGMSIAQSVVEYLVKSKRLGCKVLFATHYHELSQLEHQLPGVRNFRVAVKRVNGEIRFLRKIIPGSADESYGIDVAQLAGLPTGVIKRAKEILEDLEKPASLISLKESAGEVQMSFYSFDLIKAVKQLQTADLDEISAEEAKALLKRVLEAYEGAV